MKELNNKQKAEYRKDIKKWNKKMTMSIKKGSNIRRYYPKLYNLINKSFDKLNDAYPNRDKNAFNLPSF